MTEIWLRVLLSVGDEGEGMIVVDVAIDGVGMLGVRDASVDVSDTGVGVGSLLSDRLLMWSLSGS
jgi:hypothetical protein